MVFPLSSRWFIIRFGSLTSGAGPRTRVPKAPSVNLGPRFFGSASSPNACIGLPVGGGFEAALGGSCCARFFGTGFFLAAFAYEF